MDELRGMKEEVRKVTIEPDEDESVVPTRDRGQVTRVANATEKARGKRSERTSGEEPQIYI